MELIKSFVDSQFDFLVDVIVGINWITFLLWWHIVFAMVPLCLGLLELEDEAFCFGMLFRLFSFPFNNCLLAAVFFASVDLC